MAALIVATAIRAIWRMVERAQVRSETHRLAQRRLRFEEAKAIVLDQVLREVERGVPFKKAAPVLVRPCQTTGGWTLKGKHPQLN